MGITWPALNTAFFLLYDITLDKWGDRIIGVPSVSWKMSKYHDRKENCGSAAGNAGDDPGVDCNTPSGMVNIGPSFDAVRPGPIYMSPGDYSGSEVSVTKCSENTVDCQFRLWSGFELYMHDILG